jgi:hypothetical protein
MKFYVPWMEKESELFWSVVQDLLAWDERFTTDRRIQALLWEGDPADPRSTVVGKDLPGGEADDPVLVIHESSAFPGTMMFVCTLAIFEERQSCMALALSEHMRVVEFDA